MCPADLMAAMAAMRDAQAAAFGCQHVQTCHLAVDETGTPLRPPRWSEMWQAHCAGAGVPAVTLHAARHSSVRAMRDAGVPDHIVAAWHGHDEYIMRKVYSHAQFDGLAAAGNALAAVLSGAANEQSVTFSRHIRPVRGLSITPSPANTGPQWSRLGESNPGQPHYE
jgi:hypothetical protein